MKNKIINLGAFLLMIALSVCTIKVILVGVDSIFSQPLIHEKQGENRIRESWLTKEQQYFAYLIASGTNRTELQHNLLLLQQQKLLQQAKIYSINGELLAEILTTSKETMVPQQVFPLYFNGKLNGFFEVSVCLKPAIINVELATHHYRFYALMTILFLLGSAFALGCGYVYRSLTHKS